MKHRGTKILSLLLSLVLVLGLMPGMSLTAYADDDPPYAQYKNTTTVITFDGKSWYLIDCDANTVTLLAKECVASSKYNESGGFVEYSNNPTVKTVVDNWYSTNITADAKTAVSGGAMFLLTTAQASTIHSANSGVLKCSQASGAEGDYWWLCSQGYDVRYAASVYGWYGEVVANGYGVTLTLGVRPALKLDLSKVTFDSTSKTFSLKPSHTHSFSYSASGATITATCTGTGTCDITTGLTLSISAPTGNLVADGTTTFPAALSTGYNTTAFPANSISAISYTKDGQPFNGTPKDAGAYVASVTVGTGNGAATASVSYTIAAPQPTTYKVTYVANNGSGDTKEYNPNMGEIHTVEGQLFAAPQGKVFDNWLGDDNQTYLPGSRISTTRTLTAQWKDEQGGGNGEPGHGGNGDIVFIGGNGGGDDWGGYAAPQRTYRVSFAPMQGGSAALVLSTGESGAQMNVYPHSTIRVQAYPDSGYVLDKIIWSLIDGSASYDITQSQTFVMPAMDVVVSVSFKPIG